MRLCVAQHVCGSASVGLFVFISKVIYDYIECQQNVTVTIHGQRHKYVHCRKDCSNPNKTTTKQGCHARQPQRAGHEPVCLVPEWTNVCLCLSGVFAQASLRILRASHSSDIGITTNTTSYQLCVSTVRINCG